MVDGKEYYSAENYFQAQKSVDPKENEEVRNSGTGNDVWYAGSRVQLREDWEEVKVRVMYIGNKAKFDQHPDFIKELTKTKGSVDFGASTAFWNKWNGRIMELIREECRPEGQRDESVIKTLWRQIEEYEEKQRNQKKPTEEKS